MASASQLTPMFRQYRSLKEKHPGSILLYRMGDFYEMFFEDARIASPLLDLTLTARGKGTDNVVPMCGFPHHQLDQYTGRLVRANRRVAICEQVEDPKQAKGLVRREVVRTVTPGTVNDPDQLDSKNNLWIASIARTAGRLGAAFLDASTGELLAWECRADDPRPWESLAELLAGFTPREIVFSEELAWEHGFREQLFATTVLTPTDPFAFCSSSAAAQLEKRFEVGSLDGFGLRERPAAVTAGAGLLRYVQDTQCCDMQHIETIRFHEPGRFLLLDAATRRNLELERGIRDGKPESSFLSSIDLTITSGGARLLRRWLLAPLLDPDSISSRHEAVEQFVQRSDVRDGAREQLAGVRDVERLLARCVAGTAGARDLLGLRNSLERLPELLQTVRRIDAALVRETVDGLDPCQDIRRRIESGIVDDPPASLRDGGVIRDGFDPELDELRSIRRDGRSFIASLEAQERRTTGIPS